MARFPGVADRTARIKRRDPEIVLPRPIRPLSSSVVVVGSSPPLYPPLLRDELNALPLDGAAALTILLLFGPLWWTASYMLARTATCWGRGLVQWLFKARAARHGG
jgi:hypothetical protein